MLCRRSICLDSFIIHPILTCHTKHVDVDDTVFLTNRHLLKPTLICNCNLLKIVWSRREKSPVWSPRMLPREINQSKNLEICHTKTIYCRCFSIDSPCSDKFLLIFSAQNLPFIQLCTHLSMTWLWPLLIFIAKGSMFTG